MTAEELKEVTDFMRKHYADSPHYFAMEVINMLLAMKRQTLREAADKLEWQMESLWPGVSFIESIKRHTTQNNIAVILALGENDDG